MSYLFLVSLCYYIYLIFCLSGSLPGRALFCMHVCAWYTCRPAVCPVMTSDYGLRTGSAMRVLSASSRQYYSGVMCNTTATITHTTMQQQQASQQPTTTTATTTTTTTTTDKNNSSSCKPLRRCRYTLQAATGYRLPNNVFKGFQFSALFVVFAFFGSQSACSWSWCSSSRLKPSAPHIRA